MRELPMFPLGNAVLPGTVLPLHVFEPRYVQLLLDVQAGDGTFGTALITRGREAGTDVDQARADVGTLVRVVSSKRVSEEELRFGVVGVAESRLRIARWLPDAPYPRAEVEDLDEPEAGPEHGPAMGQALAVLADVLNLREQLDELPGAGIDDVSEDPALAAYQVAAMAGVGPLDAHRLLATDDLGDRLDQVNRSLRDVLEVLRFRLGS